MMPLMPVLLVVSLASAMIPVSACSCRCRRPRPCRVAVHYLGVSALIERNSTQQNYPLSGLFATRRSLLVDALTGVSPHGLKALLPVLAASPEGRIREVPSVLRERDAGVSKLSWRIIRADLLTLLPAMTRSGSNRC